MSDGLNEVEPQSKLLILNIFFLFVVQSDKV